MTTTGLDLLLLGNADLLDTGVWTGTPATADGRNAPLPIYPQPEDRRDARDPA